MRPRRLLRRLIDGNVRNVPFGDLCRLAEAFGFSERRVRGSHHIYVHADLAELLNLQEHSGEAKPYQIRQL